MREARIGLLGLGAASRDIHLPACSMLPGARIVGGADPDPEARSRFGDKRRGVTLYETPEQLLESESPDWVIVAAPPAQHRDLCLQALGAGAHVLCEKPFVEVASDADAILAAETASGRCVVVNHEYSEMPIFRACRQQIGAEGFGDLLLVQAWQHIDELRHESDAWRSESLTMREFGTHVLELIVEFYGSFPEKIYAQMANPGGPAGADLVDLVTLDFGAGRLASIVLDRVCRGSHRYLDMRLDGRLGSLRASLGGRASLRLAIEPRTRRPDIRLELAPGGIAWLEKGERRVVLARNSTNPFAAATAALLGNAMGCIARNLEPRTSARRALDTVRLVEAVYSSAASSNPVSFETSQPQDPSE